VAHIPCSVCLSVYQLPSLLLSRFALCALSPSILLLLHLVPSPCSKRISYHSTSSLFFIIEFWIACSQSKHTLRKQSTISLVASRLINDWLSRSGYSRQKLVRNYTKVNHRVIATQVIQQASARKQTAHTKSPIATPHPQRMYPSTTRITTPSDTYPSS